MRRPYGSQDMRDVSGHDLLKHQHKMQPQMGDMLPFAFSKFYGIMKLHPLQNFSQTPLVLHEDPVALLTTVPSPSPNERR